MSDKLDWSSNLVVLEDGTTIKRNTDGTIKSISANESLANQIGIEKSPISVQPIKNFPASKAPQVSTDLTNLYEKIKVKVSDITNIEIDANKPTFGKPLPDGRQSKGTLKINNVLGGLTVRANIPIIGKNIGANNFSVKVKQVIGNGIAVAEASFNNQLSLTGVGVEIPISGSSPGSYKSSLSLGMSALNEAKQNFTLGVQSTKADDTFGLAVQVVTDVSSSRVKEASAGIRINF